MPGPESIGGRPVNRPWFLHLLRRLRSARLAATTSLPACAKSHRLSACAIRRKEADMLSSTMVYIELYGGRKLPAKHHSSVSVGSACDDVNVGNVERLVSVIGGGWLMYTGLRQGSLAGLALAALGGGLANRGITGHCSLYSALDVSGAPQHGRLAAVRAGKGVRVNRSVTINRSAM